MKKRYDYEKIEKWARDGFSGAEDRADYRTGAAERAVNGVERTREKRQTGGFSFSPALQIVGLFLAAAIVGGTTFGALKYLERIANRTGPGSQGTTQGEDPQLANDEVIITNSNDERENTAPDMDELFAEVTKVPYDSSPDGFAYAVSGRESCDAFVGIVSTYKKTSEDLMEEALYDIAEVRYPTLNYGGDIALYNNVEDREMTVIDAYVYYENGDKALYGKPLSDVSAFFGTAPAGSYPVTVRVSWDKYPVTEVGDKCDVYAVCFTLIKTSNDQIEDKVVYDLDKNFENRYFVAVTTKGRTYYPYVMENFMATMNKDGTVDYEYYDTVAMTGTEPVIPYDESFDVLNNVSDREWYIDSIKIFPPSQADADAYETSDVNRLKEYLFEGDYGRYYVVMNITWDALPLLDPGDKAMFFTVGFAVEKKEKTGTAGDYDPEGWLSVEADSGIFLPQVTSRRVCNVTDGIYEIISEENAETHDPVFRFEDSITFRNNVRTPWYIVHFFVNGNDYTSEAGAENYINTAIELGTETRFSVKAELTWDIAAQRADTLTDAQGLKTFVYEFELEYNGEKPADPAPAGDPYGPAYLTVDLFGDPAAPAVYSKYKLNEDGEKTDVTVIGEDIPLITPKDMRRAVSDITFDEKAVQLVKTVSKIEGGDTVSFTPEESYSDVMSEFVATRISNKVQYLSFIFKVNGYDDVYVEYTVAFAAKTPGTYPYSDKGDETTGFVFENGGVTVAPAAKEEKYPIPGDLESFLYMMIPEIQRMLSDQYAAPTVTAVIEGRTTMQYSDKYEIDRVIAYQKDFNGAEPVIYESGTYKFDLVAYPEYYAMISLKEKGKDDGSVYVHIIRIINPRYDLLHPVETQPAVPDEDHDNDTARWLSSVMWNGMTVEDLIRSLGSVKDEFGGTLKARFLADDHTDVAYSSGEVYVRYESSRYTLMYMANDTEPYVIKEARLIMKQGCEGFELPFGITLDMTPEQVRSQLGLTGGDGSFEYNGLKISCSGGSLTASYLINDGGLNVLLGIEIDGSNNEAYVEIGA